MARTPPIVFAGQLGYLAAGLFAAGFVPVLPAPVAASLVSAAGILSALASGLAAVALARAHRPTSAFGWIGVSAAFATLAVTIALATAASRAFSAHPSADHSTKTIC